MSESSSPFSNRETTIRKHALIAARRIAPEADADRSLEIQRIIHIASSSVLDEMSEWQPIETAPRDGTGVLLHGDLVPPCIETGKTTVIAHWTDFNGGGWVWCGAAGSKFTHWQPIPDPPAGGV